MPDATDLAVELRGFAEGSTSARASLMRDAADALDRLAGLNEVFLNMRDRTAGYVGAAPVYRHFDRGESAFEWAATSVRRAVAGEPPLNPPVPLSELREGDRQEDGWKYYVLTCPDCGMRFSAGARVRVEHSVIPELTGVVHHYGQVDPLIVSGS